MWKVEDKPCSNYIYFSMAKIQWIGAGNSNTVCLFIDDGISCAYLSPFNEHFHGWSQRTQYNHKYRIKETKNFYKITKQIAAWKSDMGKYTGLMFSYPHPINTTHQLQKAILFEIVRTGVRTQYSTGQIQLPAYDRLHIRTINTRGVTRV